MEYLFDDGEFFAINKISGIHSVNNPSSQQPSVAGWLIKQSPLLESISPKSGDAGLINRLDFDTSGILLGARTPAGWREFSNLLKSGGIKKHYLVVLQGELKQRKEVHGWLGSPYRRSKKIKFYPSRPSPSVRALESSSIILPIGFSGETTLALISCAVARRHQVRAHCASISYPLLGDKVYGASKELSQVAPDSEKRAFFLHAALASFRHPRTGQEISIAAPAPAWILALHHVTADDILECSKLLK